MPGKHAKQFHWHLVSHLSSNHTQQKWPLFLKAELRCCIDSSLPHVTCKFLFLRPVLAQQKGSRSALRQDNFRVSLLEWIHIMGKIQMIGFFSGRPLPSLQWWTSVDDLSRQDETALVTRETSADGATTVTSSVMVIKDLRRGDQGAKVKCIASNTDVSRRGPLENSFKINIMRKTGFFGETYCLMTPLMSVYFEKPR